MGDEVPPHLVGMVVCVWEGVCVDVCVSGVVGCVWCECVGWCMVGGSWRIEAVYWECKKGVNLNLRWAGAAGEGNRYFSFEKLRKNVLKPFSKKLEKNLTEKLIAR